MEDLRCSTWARNAGLLPGGTAGTARGWLLVDWPQPWPRDVKESDALRPVRAALAHTGIRLQLVVPEPAADTARVVLHDVPHDADGWFRGCDRHELRTDTAIAAVVAAALQVLEARGSTTSSVGSDVLVCTHGRRDRCCGSLGTALAATTSSLVRRTSHLGGHRFAPTALMLPEATAWGFLDVGALQRLIERAGSAEEMLDRYRGCSALGGPAVQAAERVAFADLGWSWLDLPRRGRQLDERAVELQAVHPTRGLITWAVDVEPGRSMPIPDCGQPLGAEAVHQVELIARRRASPG